MLSCPSCTTFLLWDWAGQRKSAGVLHGVVTAGRHGDVVVYELPAATEAEAPVQMLRIPRDWASLPVRTLIAAPSGNALALADPLPRVAGLHLPDGPLRPLRPLHYTQTIGCIAVPFAPWEPPYGVVELVDARGELLHEVWGYDGGRLQWVRLAVVRLGPYELDGGRVAGGVLLTPLSLAFDVAMIAGVVCLAAGGGGGGIHGLDIELSASPPTVAERDRYWESLRGAAMPGR